MRLADDRAAGTAAVMRTAPVLARLTSAGYHAGDPPELTVVVATHNRATLLPGLIAALDGQSALDRIEVVVVDDGSTDATWNRLADLVAASGWRWLALRLAGTGGPSLPRNTGVNEARASLIAVTDDDCLPEPGWAAAMLSAVGDGGLVRGPVWPAEDPHGPWDRSIEVAGPTPWFETCNLGFERAAFVAAGGFPTEELLPGRASARGFGEDVLLGHALAERIGQRWVPAAGVRHRWLAGDYRGHLAGQWRVVGFPLLVRRVPELRRALTGRIFLTKRSAAFDLAAVCVVAATVAGPWALVGGLPWCAVAWPDARRRGRGRAPLRLAQLAVADAVTLLALLEGSARARRVVL
jgi:hypothetical protein